MLEYNTTSIFTMNLKKEISLGIPAHSQIRCIGFDGNIFTPEQIQSAIENFRRSFFDKMDLVVFRNASLPFNAEIEQHLVLGGMKTTQRLHRDALLDAGGAEPDVLCLRLGNGSRSSLIHTAIGIEEALENEYAGDKIDNGQLGYMPFNLLKPDSPQTASDFFRAMNLLKEKGILYFHKWHPGDVLLINNRSCVHGRAIVQDNVVVEKLPTDENPGAAIIRSMSVFDEIQDDSRMVFQPVPLTSVRKMVV